MPATACMNSAWSTAICTARRARTSLKGGCRWFSRSTPIAPAGSVTSARRARLRRKDGMKSVSGVSSQSTSPLCRAAAAVAVSVMIRHSTRSSSIRLPPESQSAGSSRGA